MVKCRFSYAVSYSGKKFVKFYFQSFLYNLYHSDSSLWEVFKIFQLNLIFFNNRNTFFSKTLKIQNCPKVPRRFFNFYHKDHKSNLLHLPLKIKFCRQQKRSQIIEIIDMTQLPKKFFSIEFYHMIKLNIQVSNILLKN